MPLLLADRLERVLSEPALRRDTDVMGITVCVVLLASLMTGNDHEPHSTADLVWLVWATTVGLVLTHAFALGLAVRLVADPALSSRLLALMALQVAMAAVIALTATATAVLASADYDRLAARVTAGLFLGGLVAAERRSGGASRGSAALWGVAAVGAAVGLAAAQWVLTT